jgi:hypothetical protein
MALTDDEKTEFFHDTSSQVAISMDVLCTKNDELTPEQREAIFNAVVQAAKTMLAKMMLVSSQDQTRVRMERRSSTTGTVFIDIYSE